MRAYLSIRKIILRTSQFSHSGSHIRYKTWNNDQDDRYADDCYHSAFKAAIVCYCDSGEKSKKRKFNALDIPLISYIGLIYIVDRMGWTTRLAVLGTLINVIYAQLIPSGNSICGSIRPGDDDLKAFDFISNFQLDKARTLKIKGVTRTPGSNTYQQAYKLKRNAKKKQLSVATRTMFPLGMPEEFSFGATYRLQGLARRMVWNMVDFQNSRGQSEFAVRFDAPAKSIELVFKDARSTQRILSFDNRRVRKAFNNEWHKIHIKVTRTLTTLFIDCQDVQTLSMVARSQVDINGDIVLAQPVNEINGRTVPFELQWLVIHCDPSKHQRENCEELPSESRNYMSEQIKHVNKMRQQVVSLYLAP